MIKLETTRILSKLDGFSVLLAFVLATAFQGFYSVAYDLSARITSWVGGSTDYFGYGGSGNTWQDKYLNPVFGALVWLIGVEITLQVAKYLKTQHKKK